MRRMKFLEMGFGLRKKAQILKEVVDQRRLDGSRTRAGDYFLARVSNFLSGIFEPARMKGVNWNTSRLTKEQIPQGRKRPGKKT